MEKNIVQFDLKSHNLLVNMKDLGVDIKFMWCDDRFCRIK